MPLERRVTGNLKVREQRAGVARLVVVGTEHLGRHRLDKATTTRNATKASLSEKRIADHGYQSRLVNVFTVAG